MRHGGWAPSPKWGFWLRWGTQVLSPPQHRSLRWDKEESSRRNLQKPPKWRLAITWEKMGHEGWMGTGGAALFHGRSPSPEAPCPGAGGSAPKPSTMAAPRWVLQRGQCGETGVPAALLGHPRAEVAMGMDLPCWATVGLCHPLCAGDGRSDGVEILQHTGTVPTRRSWWKKTQPGSLQSHLCTVLSLPPQVDRARCLYHSFPCSKMGVIAVNYLPHGELINVCVPL